MMKRSLVLICLGLFSVSAQLGRAHHSIAAEYDMHTKDTIEGVVSEVWFKNPHVRYYLTVADEQGEEVVWNTHGHNPVTLVRTGWMNDTIQVGDRIKVMGDATRDGSPKLFIRTVELADGRVLVSHPGADNNAN